MGNTFYMDEDLVLLVLPELEKEAVLQHIAFNLERKGLVKSSFEEALILREKEYPTGLMGNQYGIAIPHTDAEHVNKQCLSVCILKTSLEFIHMGTEDQKVPVSLIFTLAINNPEDQLDLLQKLMALIQNDTLLEQLVNSNDKKEVISLVTDALN